jgi:hypothetical protein
MMSDLCLQSPFSAASITALGISFSSIIKKSFTSSLSGSKSMAVSNGKRFGYLLRQEINRHKIDVAVTIFVLTMHDTDESILRHYQIK